MSTDPVSRTESSDKSDQKEGTGLNIHFKSPRLRKKANMGIRKTVPPILKIANACTLFVANDATSKDATGVNKANNNAVGIYAKYEKSAISIRPDRGGKTNNTINANTNMKNMRKARKLVLEIGIILRTVSKCSSLSSSIKKAAIKL
jgi:hypothetical protein